MELTEQQKKVLEYLADECERNPETSLTGIDLKLLGYKVGIYLGIGVMYDVDKLRHLGFVSRNGNKVIITQQGFDYVNSLIRLSKIFKNKYFLPVATIILIIAFIISISTHNFLWLITSILSPVISEIVRRIIMKPSVKNN